MWVFLEACLSASCAACNSSDASSFKHLNKLFRWCIQNSWRLKGGLQLSKYFYQASTTQVYLTKLRIKGREAAAAIKDPLLSMCKSVYLFSFMH